VPSRENINFGLYTGIGNRLLLTAFACIALVAGNLLQGSSPEGIMFELELSAIHNTEIKEKLMIIIR
jgi:hypothetical protein